MKKILLIFLIVFIAGLGVAWYLYNKPVESISEVQPVQSLTADQLFSAYETDEARADSLNLNKVIEVSGTVQEVQTDTSGITVTLQTASGIFGIKCQMDKNENSTDIAKGQEVRLKGICTGYLMDVVLVRCVKSEN